MTINIIQNITKILDENRQLISSSTIESYEIRPAQGKALKNINTGKIYTSFVNLNTRASIKDYIEIDL